MNELTDAPDGPQWSFVSDVPPSPHKFADGLQPTNNTEVSSNHHTHEHTPINQRPPQSQSQHHATAFTSKWQGRTTRREMDGPDASMETLQGRSKTPRTSSKRKTVPGTRQAPERTNYRKGGAASAVFSEDWKDDSILPHC
jgi:hypothetical protein